MQDVVGFFCCCFFVGGILFVCFITGIKNTRLVCFPVHFVMLWRNRKTNNVSILKSIYFYNCSFGTSLNWANCAIWILLPECFEKAEKEMCLLAMLKMHPKYISETPSSSLRLTCRPVVNAFIDNRDHSNNSFSYLTELPQWLKVALKTLKPLRDGCNSQSGIWEVCAFALVLTVMNLPLLGNIELLLAADLWTPFHGSMSVAGCPSGPKTPIFH